MSVNFYNTIKRIKEKFIPINNNEARMYTCGPTVYNYAHIGNLRSFMFEDILRRTLKFHGYKVTQIMNLTDVEDKTIKNSREAGIPLKEYTQKYSAAFFEDLKTLNIEKAEAYPAATDHIKEMIDLIKILVDKGYGYQTEDGSVYYSISKFKEYGKLAKIDMSNQRVGDRVKTDEYEKDSIADFALWKAWTEADGDVYWDSPWGKGRPGWHIECSAMSMKYLGKTFDIHTGGVDNMFPHHEDEIAQSEAANGVRFVNYWMHCEYLLVDNQKMSKSLGNFYTLRDLLKKGIKPEEIRWVLISTHYRKKLNFSFKACEQAKETLKNFSNLFDRLQEINKEESNIENLESIINTQIEEFSSAIGDDLNISGALAAVFNIQKEANKLIDKNKLSKTDSELIINAFKTFNRVLGVFNFDKKDMEVPEKIIMMTNARQLARKNKNFAEADRLRDEIRNAGWNVEDTPKGPRFLKID